MSRTIRTRLKEALLTMGGEVVPGRSSKYLTIRTPDHPRKDERKVRDGEWFWFIGKAGALRCGTTAASTLATPAERTKAWLLARVPE